MAALEGSTFRFCMRFCPLTCSEKMEIPIWIKESMGRVLPSKVLLRSRFMNIWIVVVTETGDGLYFQEGWANFARDNFLRNGEHVVFKYDGYGLFDFVLLNQFGCEKFVVIEAPPKRTKELTEDDFIIVVTGDNGEDNNNFVAEEDKTGDEEEVSALTLGLTDSKPKRDDNAGGSKIGMSVGEGSSRWKNKKALGPYGADIFISGQYKKPKNPYFVTTLGQYKRNSLYIPAGIIKDHKLILPPTIILRDPRGEDWKAYVRIWKNGKTWLAGGWRSLCRHNLVEEGDQCICEFMHHRTNDMFLQISVVRKQAAKNGLGGRSYSV